METVFTPSNIMFAISIVTMLFSLYLHFRKPQESSEKQILVMKEDIKSLKQEMKEIKETHLRALELEIKNLNTNVNGLSVTVVKLATIIDERIPRSVSAQSQINNIK